MKTQQHIMEHGLGELRAKYKSSPMYFISSAFATIMVPSMPLMIFLTDLNPFSGDALMLYIMFALLTAPLLAVTLLQIRDLNIHVFVYENGLLYQHASTRRAIHWDEVAFVWHFVSRRKHSSTHLYKLQCMDGSTLELNHAIPDVQELGKIIEWETARQLILLYRDAFASGQSVSFDQLLAHQSGLSWQGKLLFWHELENVNINEVTGIITIKKYGQWLRWASIHIFQVSNIEVLKALINHMKPPTS